MGYIAHSHRARGSPQKLDVVVFERFVLADYWHRFFSGLRYDQTVERVAVMERQRSLYVQMLCLHRELLNGVAFDVLSDESRKRERHFQLADADFDRHFPKAPNAQKARVAVLRSGVLLRR